MNRNAPPYLAWRLDRWRLLLLLLLFALLLYGALRWPSLALAPVEATAVDVTTAVPEKIGAPRPTAPAPPTQTTLAPDNPAPTSAVLVLPPPAATVVDGSLIFSGTATAAARVLLWVDGETAGEGEVDAQQRWRLEIGTALPPGRYVAQAAALDETGAVVQLSTPITFTTPFTTLGP